MKPSRRALVAVVLVTSVLLNGCPTNSPLDAQAGIDAEAGLDDSIDRSSSLDASPCIVPDAGDACNTLPEPGVFVVYANVSGTPLPPMGGVIADGRYALARVDSYVLAPGSQPDGGDMTSTDQEVVEVCGSMLSTATWSGGRLQRAIDELEITGSSIAFHERCPMVDPGPSFPRSFTANADGTWTVLLSSEGYATVSTYVPLRGR